MARNGSGSMSIINTFTPSTTISSSAVNANFSDIADEITNSLALDGQSTMTGVLKLANGTAALPSLTFGSDLNTGLYRKAADSLGFATAGTERAYFDSSGKLFALGDADVAGNFSVTGTIAITGATTLGTATVTTLNIGNADTSITRTGAGDIAVEGNGVYRAGGTDVAIADGGTGQSTAANAFAALKQNATTAATGVVQLADAAAMEALTSGRAVTADIQHRHPGHPKAWVKFDNNGVLTNNQDYGVSSLTDPGVGIVTVNYDTAFSAATNSIHVTGQRTDATSDGAVCGVVYHGFTPTTTASVVAIVTNGGNFHDTDYGSALFHGDQ